MSKYAILKIGSHQYRVQEQDVFTVEKFSQKESGSETVAVDGGEVRFSEVLFLGNNGKSQIGQPFVPGASVVCEVVKEEKQPKTISFKIKRRKGYRRKVGHRQVLTQLKVKNILPE